MIDTILSSYEKKSLEDISTVSLMNRIDSKYVITKERLITLLDHLRNTHAVVEIDDLCKLPYKTLYYDTKDLSCYVSHHNGKLNRYKYRTREYLSSNLVFDEIKHKINTGKTFKRRIKRSTFYEEMDTKFCEFAAETCETFSNEYHPQLFVEYDRITLVDKKLTERLTIDVGLAVRDYHDAMAERSFKNLVIVESKRERGVVNSPSLEALRKLRCMPQGFSKYCIGVALVKKNVKKNLLNQKLRFIEKLESTPND